MRAAFVVVPVVLVFVLACGGGKSAEVKAAERLINDYHEAVAAQDEVRLYNLLNPDIKGSCPLSTLGEVLGPLRVDRPLAIEELEVESPTEVRVKASGPWGDVQNFVLKLQADQRFMLADPLLIKCLELEADKARAEALAALEEIEEEFPGPTTLEECRRQVYSYAECIDFGLATSPAYEGPYSFSGTAKTITDDFCLTEKKVTVEYSATGIGQFPDIYNLSIWLNDEFGNFVDAESVLEGTGSLNFKTDGPGCYYLEVSPLDASWRVTVSQ